MTPETKLQQCLRDVGAAWENPDEARRLINDVLQAFPDEEDAYVAAYRYFFYRNELPAALAIAEQCLGRICAELTLPLDWRAIDAGGVDFSDPAQPRYRFLLFALNAYAYLLARLGRLAEADLAFAKVHALDPSDRIGAGRLRGVVQRGPDDDGADTD